MSPPDDEPIDMRDPENVRQAVRRAEAATRSTQWGEIPAKWCRELSPGATDFWCVYTAKDGETLICAITGDGEESRANAEFYVDARRMVLGLAAEVRRLSHDLANAKLADVLVAELDEEIARSKATNERARIEGFWSGVAAEKAAFHDEEAASSVGFPNCAATHRAFAAKLRVALFTPADGGRFVCPTCGPSVRADEDGCCGMCGADASIEATREPPADGEP